MSRKLLLTEEKTHVLSSLVEDRRLLSVAIEETGQQSMVSNLYIGRITNIVKNINAAFLSVGETTVYLDLAPYEELSPEYGPVFTKKNGNRVKNGKLTFHIGDELLIQITKDAIKTKKPMATCNFQLTSHNLIWVHGKKQVHVSSKITNRQRRNELKALLTSQLIENCGIIVRTSAGESDNECLLAETLALKEEYISLLTKGEYCQSGTCLKKSPAAYLTELKHTPSLSRSLDEIVVEGASLFQEMKEYLSKELPELLPKLTHYDDSMISLKKLYGIDEKIRKALHKHVWLKSGGFLVIEPTEAMTVIDVNTGKAVHGKKAVADTFLQINLEAAREIAFQLRLRNLSGIIIVDFIDMESEEAQKTLLAAFSNYLSEDPVTTCLVDMTALGLVELTRKKIRKPLHESLLAKNHTEEENEEPEEKTN